MRPESSENLISLPVVTPPRRGKPAKSRMSKVRFTVLIIILIAFQPCIFRVCAANSRSIVSIFFYKRVILYCK